MRRYSWHRFGFLEDCRIFAGWRFDPIDLDSWSHQWENENKKSWYFKENASGLCGSCGHPDQGDQSSTKWAASEPTSDEADLGFRPPLCDWCSFRLKLFREGVVPRTMTNDLDEFRLEKLREMAARAPSGLQPPDDDTDSPPPDDDADADAEESETLAPSEQALVTAAEQALTAVLPRSVDVDMASVIANANDDVGADHDGDTAAPVMQQRPAAARPRPRYGV